MSALNNQTNVNVSRYFFATQEAGEQTLTTTTQTAGNFTDFYVGISGPQGNQVQINQMPDVIGTVTTGGEEMLYAGTASTYKTLSSLSQTATGISLSTDRFPGTGLATIESYASNGPLKGFEFLSRGANSELVSTIYEGINVSISTVGSVGATAKLGGNGSFITGDVTAGAFSATEYPSGSPAFTGGKPCYGIRDISGADNATSQARWAIGTTGLPTGGNQGSDYTLFRYSDAGNFIDVPYAVRRSDGGTQISNISSIFSELGGTAHGQVYPVLKDNTEFGAPSNDVAIVAGATSNQALYGSTWAMLFSTPVANLNPNNQTLLNINWLHSLSTASNTVLYKVGFSTATAYTNCLQSAVVPGIGGTWTPSDLPGTGTPVGALNLCTILDPDGLNPPGDGFLYVQAQLIPESEPADQLYIAKGQTSEATRNALTYKVI